MSARFYLKTRGKTIDYRFLYEAPFPEWWCDYAEYTLFEDETIILERLIGEECKLYLSGIPSNRRDRVNTIIRYTLVAKLSKGEVSEKAFQLVHKFLDDCRNKSNTLGERLDSDFLEQYIEDALRSDGECQNQISQKIASLVNSIPYSEPSDQDEEGIWWGGLKFDDNCEKWLSLANQILNGEPGVAALLNATSEKSLPSLKERLHDKGIKNAFILRPNDGSKRKPIKDSRKDTMESIQEWGGYMGKRITRGIKKPIFPSPSIRIYLGAGVLFSAFIFLVFILAR